MAGGWWTLDSEDPHPSFHSWWLTAHRQVLGLSLQSTIHSRPQRPECSLLLHLPASTSPLRAYIGARMWLPQAWGWECHQGSRGLLPLLVTAYIVFSVQRSPSCASVSSHVKARLLGGLRESIEIKSWWACTPISGSAHRHQPLLLPRHCAG